MSRFVSGLSRTLAAFVLFGATGLAGCGGNRLTDHELCKFRQLAGTISDSDTAPIPFTIAEGERTSIRYVSAWKSGTAELVIRENSLSSDKVVWSAPLAVNANETAIPVDPVLPPGEYAAFIRTSMLAEFTVCWTVQK